MQTEIWVDLQQKQTNIVYPFNIMKDIIKQSS